MIIDTHIHLDDSRYDDDFKELLQRAYENSVERFIIPGADPKTLDKAVKIAENHENIYFAIGVHPYDIDDFNEEIFLQYINHPKCVAVGECGMDYFRLEGTQEEKEALKKVCLVSASHNESSDLNIDLCPKAALKQCANHS